MNKNRGKLFDFFALFATTHVPVPVFVPGREKQGMGGKLGPTQVSCFQPFGSVVPVHSQRRRLEYFRIREETAEVLSHPNVRGLDENNEEKFRDAIISIFPSSPNKN
jgi:hypothetical protein